MLTDLQIEDLAKRMDIPLERVCFKNELCEQKLKYNRSYIINMENSEDEYGKSNEGTHWTCFQVNKYPDGKIEGIYFDSFGQDEPQAVEKFVGRKLPYNTKDIQSLMNSACGWYCLAFLHYINAYEHRAKHLYSDVESFLDLFEDLSKSILFKKNEFILKHFFRSSNPDKRKPIDVSGSGDPNPNSISGEDQVQMPVDVKFV